jgi:hypothetical protein
MIKHIVLWKLKNEVNGKSRLENALRLKQELESLNGIIPGMLLLEVGVNIQDSESGGDDSDVTLYSEFKNIESLENYYLHPKHTKIKPFAKSIRSERRVINYEVGHI